MNEDITHEYDGALKPEEDVRLADGRPLYHALLENPHALVLTPREVQKAGSRLLLLMASNPKKVLECQDRTWEDAKSILESIEE